MHESFWCTTPCWAFGVGSVPNFSHANRCIVVSHYCFNLRYLDDIWCGESLHMLICHLFIFNEMSIQVFGTLFQIICFLIVEFLRLFCIFSVTILNQMCFFANIFSQFGAFVFILFTSWIFFFCLLFFPWKEFAIFLVTILIGKWEFLVAKGRTGTKYHPWNLGQDLENRNI